MTYPAYMSQVDLTEIASELAAVGQVEEANALLAVQADIEANEKPPGLFKRLSTAVRETAQRQWEHIVGELQESKEAWSLIQQRIKGGEPLSDVETNIVKTQLLDIFKVFPATVVATANAALPVPGTGLFTPWLLNKLGLMPTRWREARALDQLQDQEEHLRSIGDIDHADKLHAIIEQLEAEADARQEVQERCGLLTVWDANENGLWDSDEVEAYSQAVQDLRETLSTRSHHKHWYFMLHSHVFGPMRLHEMDEWSPDEKLLVCYDASSGWVSYVDLVREDGALSIRPEPIEP